MDRRTSREDVVDQAKRQASKTGVSVTIQTYRAVKVRETVFPAQRFLAPPGAAVQDKTGGYGAQTGQLSHEERYRIKWSLPDRCRSEGHGYEQVAGRQHRKHRFREIRSKPTKAAPLEINDERRGQRGI